MKSDFAYPLLFLSALSLAFCSCSDAVSQPSESTQKIEDTTQANVGNSEESVEPPTSATTEPSTLNAVVDEQGLSSSEKSTLEAIAGWDGFDRTVSTLEVNEPVLNAARTMADRGNAEFQFRFANMLLRGQHVPTDAKQAVSYLQSADRQGHLAARHSLGLCLLHGIGRGKDEKKGYELLVKNAESGFARSENSLGQLLLNGKAVEKNEEQAVRWLRKAADHGNADAKVSLGLCMLAGIGMEKNEAAAAKTFQEAAEDGNFDGMCKLAHCYDNGIGVAMAPSNATDWYQIAANGKHLDAWYALGERIYIGKGSWQNRAKGRKWLEKAAAEGHERSKLTLANMAFLDAQADANSILTDELKRLRREKREIEDYHSEENMLRRAYEAASRGGY